MVVEEAEDLRLFANNTGTVDEELQCPFVFVDVQTEECIPFDTDYCARRPDFRPPTPLPSSAPTYSPAQSPSNCYTNLDLLSAAMAAKVPSQIAEFILCPNTIFPIGSLDINSISHEGGFGPLTLRANSHVKCGNDGLPTNNCVLTGGAHQVLSFPYSPNDVRVNVRLEGITFELGREASALLAAPGDVVFQSCVFRVSKNCHDPNRIV